MADILAIIGGGDKGTHAVLAREALRKAAAAAGRTIEVEVRTADSVLDPLDPGKLGGAGTVLIVGEGVDDTHLAGATVHRATLDEVLADADGVLARAANGKPAGTQNAAAPAVAAGPLKIVAVTSCPTGIAHTFMAAEGLQGGAKVLGHAIRVETQGSVGAQDGLTPAEIAEADLVVIAADKQVDLARFAGKRVFLSPTKPAITDGAGLIRRALAEARVQDAAAGAASEADGASSGADKAGVYRHLMTGVSFMLPFVVAGGLLIAIAFALGGIYVYEDQYEGTLGWTLFQIGSKGAFALMVPALGGYIAYSIADRPGIAPGMVGGLIATSIEAGFLGGIAAGFIAGYTVLALTRTIRLPKNLAGLMPVLILPLLATAVTGLLMYYVVGTPTARLLAAMTAWLQGMQGSSAAILGLILGGMMAVDMGGPVNKAAYAFGTALISSGVTQPMAAIMCAGMTPPLALALACRLFPTRFTADEREAGNAAFVLGLAFVTEGAIPFAARDPLRVIPSLIAGSAVAGAICMALAVELRVPHGGIFVLPIPNAVSNLTGFVIALVVGTLVSTAALGILKRSAAPVAVPAQA
ncbi:fructose-specific PTS transporter subunit EIIC [Rhizobiaceae bacterium BDR2-2]|uniref:protein-N(pi)-phosphohistidine--D-fructose phosphotransferase n=1 Tax=Ectorhizobium quercum TaxID=2965071 RepID=A0AAE3SWE4_9HYPH|nr:fructose-specific PTS transporter subunit EIIC [Ectorhizobium quercum]MCX8997360.1 fructose-specific PTS transporter subunit EIIC [Ectorhizobium quercum]